MNKKFEILILGCLAVVLILILSFFGPSQNRQKRLCIASAESEFKKAVTEKVKTYFENKHIKISSVSLDSLVSLPKDDFDVLAVLNSCWNNRFQDPVESYMSQLQDQSNVIVLTTSHHGDWLPDLEQWDCDVLACASKMSSVDSVSQAIIEKINMQLLSE